MISKVTPINPFIEVKPIAPGFQGAQPLGPLSFQGNEGLSRDFLDRAASHGNNGLSPLRFGALGKEGAIDGNKGARLNTSA